jgi:hypothetical protein
MNNKISSDLFIAVRPLLYASRALGLAPFAYVKRTLPGGRTSEELEHSSASFIYSIFLIILVLFSCLCAIIFDATSWYSEMGTSEVVPVILVYTVNIIFLASLVLNLTKSRNGIVRIMFLTVKIDEVLLKTPSEYYEKAKINLIVQLIVIFSFLGFSIIYDCIVWILVIGVNHFAYFHTYLIVIIEWLVIIHFMNWVVLLKDRFSLLNERLSLLSGIFETENLKKGVLMRGMCVNVRERTSQITKEEVLTFNSIYDILCDTALLVKSTYEVQILLSVLSTFVNMTILLYFGLCFLYGYSSVDDKVVIVSHLVISFISWCLVYLAKLLCITISCHSFNNKMAETSVVLGKLLLAVHHDLGTMRELKRFSHHVTLRQFKFTSFGFLSLDLSLLVSVLGAVATYLVILMQFKMAVNTSPACCRNVTG